MKALHCYDPEERRSKFTQLLICMTSYDKFYSLPDDDDITDTDEVTSLVSRLIVFRSIV